MVTQAQQWRQTRLWQLIKSKDAMPDANSPTFFVEQCMAQIYPILQSGGSAPSQFTLHDSQHGDRVAERMFDFLDASAVNQLGSFEITLLLLSAYLHDIGMTPAQGDLTAYRIFLETGAPTSLSAVDRENFQHWIDVHYPSVSLGGSSRTEADVSIRDEALAYFVRHMHNDWSEKWIRQNLVSTTSVLYVGWIDDLVALCRSHHEGLNDLRSTRFDARLVGAPSQVVNLRYLAAVLRVADVVEFDPERTPEVVLRHRAIPASSRIYWYKDHAISFSIDQSSHQIIFSAITPSAAIHKAVLDTAKWVDDELLCCSTLQSEGAFQRGTIPRESRAYTWPWPAKLTSDVRVAQGKFIYIDGAFRPNADRLLELLSSTDLYENPFAAVREMVQNAADAIEEKILWEAEAQAISVEATHDFVNAAANLHRIELTIERVDNGIWLRCSDNGVGMDAKALQSSFLSSGSPRRSELVRLERMAKRRGAEWRRTGQFGIGVLSYFMIGDRLEITTRKSFDAPPPHEPNGWRFEIDGLHDFGQLSPTLRSMSGTDVRLRLREDWLDTERDDGLVDRIASQVAEYLMRAIGYAPCSLVVRGARSIHTLAEKRGWIRDAQYVLREHARHAACTPPTLENEELATKAEREIFGQRAKVIDAINQEASSRRRYKLFEVESIGGVARARIWIPYYEYDQGNSLLNWRALDGAIIGEGEVSEVRDNGVLPSSYVLHTWKGFHVDARLNDQNHRRFGETASASSEAPVLRGSNGWFQAGALVRVPAPAIIELDWSIGGRIAIHRQRMLVDKELLKVVTDELVSQVEAKLKDFLDENIASAFNWYDRKLTNLPHADRAKSRSSATVARICGSGFEVPTKLKLESPAFPMVIEARTSGLKGAYSLRVGRKEQELPKATAYLSLSRAGDYGGSHISPVENLFQPELVRRLVRNGQTVEHSATFSVLWHEQLPANCEVVGGGITNQKILDEPHSLAVFVGGRTILNRGSKLSEHFDADLWKKLDSVQADKWKDDNWIKTEVLSSSKNAVTYLLNLHWFGDAQLWTLLNERSPHLAKDVFTACEFLELYTINMNRMVASSSALFSCLRRDAKKSEQVNGMISGSTLSLWARVTRDLLKSGVGNLREIVFQPAQGLA